MKKTGFLIPLLAALVCVTGPASAASSIGSELMSFSVLSGTYVSTGDSAKIYGNVLARTYGTTGANSAIYGNFQSGDVATAGANAMVQGDFQAILDGTTGANSTVKGNFQAGTTGTTGAYSAIKGNFLSGAAGTTGANSTIDGTFKAGGAVSLGASSSIAGVNGVPVQADTLKMTDSMTLHLAVAKSQLDTEKIVLTSMGSGIVLVPTMTIDTTLKAGVYSAASWSTTAGTTLYLDGQNKANQSWVFNITNILATGASTKIELINAGADSKVFWNTGGYASLGASSTFVGTILATDYISVGASANLRNSPGSSCGGLFSSTSYVSVGAGATIGSDGCTAATPSITTAVPEPEFYAMLLAGLGLVSVMARRRSKKLTS